MFKHKILKKDIDRFWKYVDKRDEKECWPWLGTLDHHGYGVYSVRHVLYKAHRASYYFYHGDIDDKLVCCHTCDNPKCVNPNHLWIGTQHENSLDRDKKGRTRTGHLYGEDNPQSKLTESDVCFIRKNYNPKQWSTRKLAKKFGVSQTKIRQILSYKSWRRI